MAVLMLLKPTVMVAGVLAASLSSSAVGAALLLPGVLSTSFPEGRLSQLSARFRHPCPAFINPDGSAPSACLAPAPSPARTEALQADTAGRQRLQGGNHDEH